MVFLEFRTHVLYELLDLFHEVRMDVGLDPSDPVVGLDKPSSGGLFQYVQDFLPVPEAEEEHLKRAHVLAQAGDEQQMRVNPLQLVHYCPYIFDPFGNLQSHGFFYAHAKGMAVLHRAQIVKPVGESESLRVSHCLTELFDSSVDISAVYVQLLDDFPFERDPEAEHAVRSRMLRPDIDHIFLVFEKRVPFQDIASVLGHDIARGIIVGFLVLHVEGIEGHVIVLAQRIAFPVIPEV